MRTRKYATLSRVFSVGLWAACMSVALTPSVSAEEQQTSEADKVSLNVALNSDSFFGFYPTFQGGYKVDESFDATIYGILWSGGVGENWGNWTEAGLGFNYKPIEGLGINPQVGFLSGNLLSSGTKNDTMVGDGVVPNLTINLNRERIEGQIYAGYYTNIRDAAPDDGTTLRYLHYWGNLGYKLSSFVSSGVHWESLVNTGGSNVDSASDVYRWIGPYVQFSKPSSSAFARVTAGPDLRSGNDSFMKVNVGFTF